MEDELVGTDLAVTTRHATLHWFNKTLIDHIGPLQVEALRQVLNTTVVRLAGNLTGSGIGILKVDGILVAHKFLTLGIDIGTRQVTLLPPAVIEFEGTVQLQVVVGIAEATVTI